MAEWAADIEWLALFGFLAFSTFSTVSFAAFAALSHYDLWHKTKRPIFPSIVPPALPFLGAYSLFASMVAIGTWFVWREGIRATGGLGLPAPQAGSNPDPAYLVDIVYLLTMTYFMFKVATGGVFWCARWFGTSVCFEVVQWLSITGLTVVAFLIWYVPGIFFALAWLWETYLVIVSGLIANQRSYSRSIHMGHFQRVFEHVEPMWAPQKKTRKSKPTTDYADYEHLDVYQQTPAPPRRHHMDSYEYEPDMTMYPAAEEEMLSSHRDYADYTVDRHSSRRSHHQVPLMSTSIDTPIGGGGGTLWGR